MRLFFFLSKFKCTPGRFDVNVATRLVSNNTSNTAGATCGARFAYSSRAPEITPKFLWGSCCLVFSFLRSVMCTIMCLFSFSFSFADGTYKCCPNYFKQIYTIHGFKNGHYIPLVFCLLPSKSEACYKKMFSLLGESCKQINLTLNITTIHLDFEDRNHKTVRDLSSDVVIKTCRFNLGQAWWRKIQNFGLAKENNKNGSDISKWLHNSSD